MLPGAGGEITSIIATKQSWDAKPERFGTGVSVAASESSNNAVIGGSLIPMLTLGIPAAPWQPLFWGHCLPKVFSLGLKFLQKQQTLPTPSCLQVVGNLLLIPVGYFLQKSLPGCLT